jgi:hypothetical protein
MGVIHKNRRYVKDSAIIRQYANVTPTAVCWRCGETMAQHQARHPNRRLTWHAGHTIKGSTSWHAWFHVSRVPPLPPHPQAPQGGWLAPEVSYCNIAHGNREREPSSGWL